ncbi:MAG: extracellular solute-binding protein, partial [Anaerolineales bacterium]|nr:extracellular solute-binding protein [Anaerolineales bacterium]
MFQNLLHKVLPTLVVLSLLLSSLVACAGTPQTPTQTPTQTPAPSPQPAETYQWGEWRNTDPYRPYDERKTVSVVKGGLESAGTLPTGETIEDNRALKYIEDTLNIDITFKWVATSDAYLDKLNLAIASRDVPDVMIVSPTQLQQLAEANAIEDLTPYIEKYANADILRNYRATNNLALQAATINGKIMGIPNVQPQADAPIMAFVRRDWLEKLGLQPPKTVEDIEKIARAFIAQDPDGNGAADTYGITGTMNPINVPSNLHGFDAFFNAYGAFPELFYRDKTGKIVYGSVQPEVKEALGLIARWHKE